MQLQEQLLEQVVQLEELREELREKLRDVIAARATRAARDAALNNNYDIALIHYQVQ